MVIASEGAPFYGPSLLKADIQKERIILIRNGIDSFEV